MVSSSISRQRAFLRADAAGEVAEMIDRQRHVGDRRLADRLAVVDGLDERRARSRFSSMRSAILFRIVGALGGRGLAPRVLARACAASSACSMSSAVERAISQTGSPVIGVMLSKYWPFDRRHPLAADEIVVARAQRHPRIQSLDDLMKHTVLPWTLGAAFRVLSDSILSPALTCVKRNLKLGMSNWGGTGTVRLPRRSSINAAT